MAINSSQIKAAALDIGFHLVGITSIDGHDDQALAHLKSWLDLGYQADMAWMASPKRENIRSCLPESRSLISLALNYYTPHQHVTDPQIGKISRYGWGRDYHKVISKKLKALNNWLKSQDEDVLTRYYVDTGPVQEKVWAQRAGIGWLGKNANLITREYGSWIFLSEVLTNLELFTDLAHTNHCGTCDRCLTACPTGAIVQPYVVDANRCIAYHTIENREAELPEAIADNLSGWVAGCDICQDVCPWNQRFAKETDIVDFQPYPDNVQPNLHQLATISDVEWDQRFRGSALRRIKAKMWRRNARANIMNE